MQQAHFYEMDGGPSGIWWEAVINEVRDTTYLTFNDREQAFEAAHDFTLQGWTVSIATLDLYYAAEEVGTL
jgi:hypothetical protein